MLIHKLTQRFRKATAREARFLRLGEPSFIRVGLVIMLEIGLLAGCSFAVDPMDHEKAGLQQKEAYEEGLSKPEQEKEEEVTGIGTTEDEPGQELQEQPKKDEIDSVEEKREGEEESEMIPVDPVEKEQLNDPKSQDEKELVSRDHGDAGREPEKIPYGYLNELAEKIAESMNAKRQHKLSWNEKLAIAAREQAKEVNDRASTNVSEPIKLLAELGIQYGSCAYGHLLFLGETPKTLTVHEILEASGRELMDENLDDVGVGVYYGKNGLSLSIILTSPEPDATVGSGNPAEPGPAGKEARFLADIEENIWRLVNKKRQEEGLPPLSWSEEAGKIARAKAKEMYDYNYFAHGSPYSGSMEEQFERFGGLVLGENVFAIGENIAMSTGRSKEQLAASFWMDMWMNSPGHRANILNENYTHMGVGVILGEDGRAIAVQEFCTPN